MRLLTIAIIVLLGSSKAWAHHTPPANYYHPHYHGLEQQIMVAYAYPNQLEAAIRWRLKHPYADISLHIGKFHHRGWHPSIIALLHHPHFLNDLYYHPRWHVHYWDRPWYKKYHKGYHSHHRKYKHHYYKPWNKKRYRKKYHNPHKKRVRVRERD